MPERARKCCMADFSTRGECPEEGGLSPARLEPLGHLSASLTWHPLGRVALSTVAAEERKEKVPAGEALKPKERAAVKRAERSISIGNARAAEVVVV